LTARRFAALGWILVFAGVSVGASESRPPERIFELDQFRVIATRTALPESDIPASVGGLARGDLQQLAAADAADLLRFEPLVDLPFDVGGNDAFVPYQSPGYSSYTIRGVGGNRVLLQIDGIRQASVFSMSGGTRRDLFDPWLLSSLEIFKGTASSLYGSDALGGVVALSTGSSVPPGANRLDVGLRYHQANEGRALLGMASVAEGPWALRLGHVRRKASERENFGDVPENPESIRSDHSLASLHWEPSRQHGFRLTGELFTRKARYDLDSAEGFQPQLLLDLTEVSFASDQKRERISLDYSWTPDPSPVESASLLIYAQSARTDARSRQVGEPPGSFGRGRDRTDRISFQQEQTGLEGNLTLRQEAGAWAHRLTGGISLESATAENGFLRTDPLAVNPVQNLIGMAPSRTLRGAVYLQDEIRWRKAGLIAGLRLEHYAIEPENTKPYVNRLNKRLPTGFPPLRAIDYDLTSWAPSLAFSYHWSEELMTYARYARGYRQPTAGEFTGLFFHGAEFVLLPNSELEEEVSDAYEAGLKWLSERAEVQVAVFTTDYKGFFETVATGEKLDPEDPLSLEIQQIRNVSAARLSGFEISSRWHLFPPDPDRATRLQLMATLGQAWGENRNTGAPLASVSPMKAVGGLSWEAVDGRWNALLTSTYRAEHHDPPTETIFVPEASLVWDFSASYRPVDGLRLEAGIRNLTNERYHIWANSNQGIHFADNPGRSTLPGRNAFIGIRLKF
jgi:hemoglobin/transferrin/lactoferrin receptor protein